MKRVLGFAAVSLTVVVGAMWLLGLAFRGPADERALQVAAGAALVVQIVAFLVARRMARQNVIAGWGAGVGIRFAAFVFWGLVVVSRLALPQSAALLAMATYLFLTTLIEPLFLKT
ncbi:MAG: hypothetical protein U0163_21360 [Gemmatimonadaceae bacterium]